MRVGHFLSSKALPFLACLVFGVSCTEPPTTPSNVSLSKKLPHLNSAGRDYSIRTGAVITTYDDYYNSLTLDGDASEIRYSDGRVIPLTSAELTEYVNHFEGNFEYDGTSNVWDSSPEPGCNESYACEEPSAVTGPPVVKLDGNKVKAGKGDVWGLNKIRQIKTTQKNKNGVTTTLDWPSNCSQMRVELIYAVHEYRDTRKSFFSALWDAATSGWSVSDGRLTILPSPWSALKDIVSGWGADKAYQGLHLAIAKSLFAASGCGYVNWPAGASGSFGSHMGLVCEWGYITIPFKDGESRTYYAQICNYDED